MPLRAVHDTTDVRASRAVGTYIQREAEVGHALQILLTVALIWFFAGFAVYWLVTGSWTIGVGGRMSSLGGLLWVGPLVIGLVLILAGPRGRLHALWRPRTTLRVDRLGLAWEAERPDGRAPGSVSWSDVEGLRPRLWSARSSLSVECQVLGPRGALLATLPERWKRVDGPRTGARFHGGDDRLTELAVAVRPDRYRMRRRVFNPEAVLIDRPAS
ncbi:MAG TPA: hypothetical protein VFY18_02395 [Candidatus Limnocylindrales bacterium]|nr:hypothetical protein [Candidatus Limnocylindrales bacterium]